MESYLISPVPKNTHRRVKEWPTKAMVRTILVHIGYKLTGQANNLCMFHDSP
jgi:hypothetical protein